MNARLQIVKFEHVQFFFVLSYLSNNTNCCVQFYVFFMCFCLTLDVSMSDLIPLTSWSTSGELEVNLRRLRRAPEDGSLSGCEFVSIKC